MVKVRSLFMGLLCLFFVVNVFAFTDNKVGVEQAYNNWCRAIGTAKGNSSEVVRYYAPGALLLPTLSYKILVNTRGGLNAYFTTLTKKPNIKCTTDKLITRLYGNMFAINSGYYTFTFTDTDGRTKAIPARFSFVYERFNQGWLIINHHSSVLPSS